MSTKKPIAKKKNRIKSQAREFSDMDYRDKLSPAEQSYLDKFENEFYADNHYLTDSIHRKQLGSKFTDKIVGVDKHGREINLEQAMTNEAYSRKNDVYAIAKSTNRLAEIDIELFANPEDDHSDFREYDLNLKFHSDAADVHNEMVMDLIKDMQNVITEQEEIALVKRFSLNVIELHSNARKHLRKETKLQLKEKP